MPELYHAKTIELVHQFFGSAIAMNLAARQMFQRVRELSANSDLTSLHLCVIWSALIEKVKVKLQMPASSARWWRK
jgi:hypothetical protein